MKQLPLSPILTGIIFWAMITSHAAAQNIEVRSSGTQKTLEGVQIYSSSQHAITGPNGQADISPFADSSKLHFKHINFGPHTIQKSTLPAQDAIVYLHRKVTDLDEVIVSAMRWEQQKNEIPNKITTVNKSAINLANPQTAADLLSLTGEVYIQKSQLGGGSPMIRGFATSRILMVVDGVRMNNAIFRSGNLQNVISLDAHNVGNSEVIFGPGPVIYGSDAIGGVMDFHTERIPLQKQGGSHINHNIMLRHSTANAEKTAHHDVTVSREKWGSYTSISYSDYGHLQMGSRGHPEYQRQWLAKRINGQDTMVRHAAPDIQRYSAYNQLNVLQKIRLQPTSNLNFNYALHYSETSDIPRYDRLIVKEGGKPQYATWNYGPQRWQMHSLTATYSAGKRLFDQAKLTAAWQNYQESRHDRKFGEPFLRNRHEEVDIASLNLDMDKQAGKHSFFYGLEGVYNKVHSQANLKNINTGERSPYASRYPDGSEYAYASGYLAWKYRVHSQIILNAGIRMNQHLLKARFDTTFYPFPFRDMQLKHGAANGNLGVVYKNAGGWRIAANLATGFKAPNIDDAGKVFDSEPGTVIVPNPDLASEYAWNGELRMAKSWMNNHQLEITGFYTLLEDAMVRREFAFNGKDSITYDGQLSQVKALVNADQARVYGMQLGGKINIGSQWYLTGRLNWIRGQTKDGTPMRHVAPMFGDMHIQWMQARLRLDAFLKFNGKKPHSRMAPSELGKPHMYARNAEGNLYAPAWYTLNLKAQWRINKQFQLSGGVENILDVRYRPYASGIAAPGRNFILALRGYF